MLAAAGLVHVVIQPVLGATLAGLVLGIAADFERRTLAVGAATQALAGLLVAGGALTDGGLEVLAFGLAFVSLTGAVEVSGSIRKSIGRRLAP